MYNRLPKLLQEMNSIEVETAIANELPLFLPVGTLEAHGRHLPVGTDTLCAQKIAEELSLNIEGVVAPAIAYGITNSLVQTSPGSHFKNELYEEYLKSVILNLHKQGFKTIIVINGHGGNIEALKKVARNLTKTEKIALSVIHWWLLTEKHVKNVYGQNPGGHAAIEETAAMLHYYPTLVTPDNFEPEQDVYEPNNAIWLYPPPGEVLVNKYNEGLPNFDCGKAADFTEALIKDIATRLNRWINSINRIKGGLRP